MDIYTASAAPNTLILLNKTRLDRAYGVAETNPLSDQLKLLADAVNGIIWPVDNNANVIQTYSDWDNDACDVQAANDVSWAIWDEIVSPTMATHPISYVVLVGNDLQIPFRRVPDDVQIANERTFVSSSHVTPTTPLGSALDDGNILTDDFYGDRVPFLWKGRWLYVPDAAVGRLVEEPGEIYQLISTFLVSDTLHANTALATGYDFLTDSANAITQTMEGQGLSYAALINEDWTAAELRANWSDAPQRVDLASVNGHFEHWRTQPADTSTTFYNTDIINATNTFTGTVNFSMGCHGGLNVPDESSHPGTWNPDYPQVFSREAATWVANTGYGYGMDDAIAGSEQIYYYFQKMLGSEDEITAGEALRRAKWYFLQRLGIGGLGPYEEKSLIETTLYGLPMHKVNLPDTIVVGRQSPQASATDGDFVTEYSGDQIKLTLTPSRQSGDNGEFFSLDDEVQASAGRPLQPRTSVTVPASVAHVHGLVVLTATMDIYSDFDPVIYRPITDTSLTEPGFSYSGWYPNKFWSLNTLGEETRLVVIAGQYQPATAITGTERVFSSLTFKVFTATNQSDVSPPIIHQVEASGFSREFAVVADISDSDTEVVKVWVTYEDTTGHWTSAELTYNSATGLWEGTVSSSLDEFNYFVQAVDSAGNVSASSNKGLYFAAEPEKVYLPVIARSIR
jgi:hypothetical protein